MCLIKKTQPSKKTSQYVSLVVGLVVAAMLSSNVALGQSGSRISRGSSSRGVPAGGFSGGSSSRGGVGIPASGNFRSAYNVPRIEFRPEVIRGTLVDVNKVGGSIRLAVRDENGNEESVAVNSKIQTALLSSATTDELEQDQFVSIDARRIDGRLVANEYLVYVGYKSRDLPIGIKATGRGSRKYLATGKILEIQKSDVDSNENSVTLDVRGRKKPTIEYNSSAKVTVQNSDLSDAPAGSLVEIKGVRASNGAFQIQSITVADNSDESKSEPPVNVTANSN